MARQLRIKYAGAIYHVMSRGDRREQIFLDDEDRIAFTLV
jgi:putative transposase